MNECESWINITSPISIFSICAMLYSNNSKWSGEHFKYPILHEIVIEDMALRSVLLLYMQFFERGRPKRVPV